MIIIRRAPAEDQRLSDLLERFCASPLSVLIFVIRRPSPLPSASNGLERNEILRAKSDTEIPARISLAEDLSADFVIGFPVVRGLPALLRSTPSLVTAEGM